MVEPPPPNPTYIIVPAMAVGAGDPLCLPPPPPPSAKRPWVRVTSEFDSESLIFLHKVSCKVFDNLAKLKLSFNNNTKREISHSHLAFTSKHLSLHYDAADHDALIKTSFHWALCLHFKASHFLKAQQSEGAMVANLAHLDMPLSSHLLFPMLVCLEQPLNFLLVKFQLKRTFSINGILKGQVLNGVCAANYKDEELKIRYSYKDEALSFYPKHFTAFKCFNVCFQETFNPSDKLRGSCWLGFSMGWKGRWQGKSAPMKMKVQCMLQIPQDDIKSSALMFRVKKRWDIWMGWRLVDCRRRLFGNMKDWKTMRMGPLGFMKSMIKGSCLLFNNFRVKFNIGNSDSTSSGALSNLFAVILLPF
ncbi:hypothetical protein CRYUN_Cryun05aG0278700 [Craigia yunnanensis]